MQILCVSGQECQSSIKPLFTIGVMLGKKHVRDIKPPGLENSVRPTFPLGDVTISVCKDSFPLEFPALLYRAMRRGKQQLGFLLSACATKPPFTRGTFQIMHIRHKRNYVVSGITFDNKGQYSNNMVSSCAGCMKRTLPIKFLWLFFVAIYCSSITLPWHQQRHQREPTCLLFSGMLVTLTSGTISPLNSSWWGSSCSSWTTFVLSTGSACSWGKQKLPHLTTIPSLPIYPWAKHMGVHLVTVHRDFPAGGILCEEDQTSC